MEPAVERLKSRIQAREYEVGIVGLGYVGLPLLLRFGEAGFRVLGFDIDPAKIERLNAGESYIKHIDGQRVKALASSGRLAATSDPALLARPDAIIICVPTPLTPHRTPDMQYIEKTAETLRPVLRRGQLVSLESTTYPGTTDELLLPILESTGLRVGVDFYLAYSPEREDPGNASFTTVEIPKVVAGTTEACRELAVSLYGSAIAKVVPVSSTRVAEATKILENVYRGVNIALVNELKVVFSRMGLDVWEVIEAAKTKPFGFQAFYPGPGLGGHCIPIDPFYLSWKAREYGVTTRFIELAGEINHAMPLYVVERLADALNDRRKALRGARILVLGVSYKRDVDDLRESPALEIIEILRQKGASVEYSDPFFREIPPVRRHDLHMRSVLLDKETLARFDAVLLTTDHSDFPYSLVHDNSQLIVDTRNAFAGRGLRGTHVIGA